MSTKKRLDILLVEKGLFSSRSKAKRSIMAGKVYVNDEIVDKAGTTVSDEASIVVKGNEIPYVSRGGLKLEKALQSFSINPVGKEVIDIGASTGGFTDCLLQSGAKKVYAIDVGYGQLAWKLRQDRRVEVIERTNFRYLTPSELPVKVSLIVTDVSFISLRLIIPPALEFLKVNGEIIALIKPQFEAGRERVGKNGIVKDKNTHRDVLQEMIIFFNEKGLKIKGLDYSPITGATSKNIEFLIHLKYLKSDNNIEKNSREILEKWKKDIDKIVEMAHKKL